MKATTAPVCVRVTPVASWRMYHEQINRSAFNQVNQETVKVAKQTTVKHPLLKPVSNTGKTVNYLLPSEDRVVPDMATSKRSYVIAFYSDLLTCLANPFA